MHVVFMVVISERKTLELIEFERIIKRCPICLKDTEQRAYYSHRPDLTVRVKTETTPQIIIKILPSIGHMYEWDVLATCLLCSYTYRVTGVPKMKEKDIPKKSLMGDIEFALICCDVCYNDYYRYTIGDVFINLTAGEKVYLCKSHAGEIESEKTKFGNYNFLLKRIGTWSSKKEVPIVVRTKSGAELLLKKCDGITSVVLKMLLQNETLTRNELFSAISKNTNGVNNRSIEESIGYLKGISILEEKEEGSFIKKRVFSLSESGKDVADAVANLPD